MSEVSLESFGITGVQSMIATPNGMRLLGDTIRPWPIDGTSGLPTSLVEYVRLFAENPRDAYRLYSHFDPIEGLQSRLFPIGEHRELGALVLKVSTTSIKSGVPKDGRRYGAEDLLKHTRLMNSLGGIFEQQPGCNLSVPEHYFAMRALGRKRTLTVMRFLPDVADVDDWISYGRSKVRTEAQRIAFQHANQTTLQRIATRIQRAIVTVDPNYRKPLGELFYDDEREEGEIDRILSGKNVLAELERAGFSRSILNSRNVLLDPGTDPNDIDQANLWVIDSPPPFGPYAEAAEAALQHRDHYRPGYVEWTLAA